MDAIKKFVIDANGDPGFRGLIAGILWLGDTVVTNTHQLRCLIGGSKSSLNTALARLGLAVVPDADTSALKRALPKDVANDPRQLREWTVRSSARDSPAPTLDVLRHEPGNQGNWFSVEGGRGAGQEDESSAGSFGPKFGGVTDGTDVLRPEAGNQGNWFSVEGGRGAGQEDESSEGSFGSTFGGATDGTDDEPPNAFSLW
jgi:hypothetical protein